MDINKEIEKLIKSSEGLKQPSVDTAKEYTAQRDSITTELTSKMKNEKMLHSLMESVKTAETGQAAMLEDSYKYRTMFMESIFTNFNPKELVNTYIWAMRVIRSRGMDGMLWDLQLKSMKKILKEKLSKDAYGELEPIYDWMINILPDIINIVDYENDK